MSEPPYEVTITYPVWEWSPELALEWAQNFVAQAGDLCVGAGGGCTPPCHPTQISVRQTRERLVIDVPEVAR